MIDYWIVEIDRYFLDLNKLHFVMQKRGRPPSRLPTEQVTVRLPRAMLERFRRNGRGVSAEIQARLTGSIYDDERDPQLRKLEGQIEQLAKDVRRTFGAEWHQDEKAHRTFIETLRRLFDDVPLPAAQISKIAADPITAADLIYRLYVGTVRDLEAGAEISVRPASAQELAKKAKEKRR